MTGRELAYAIMRERGIPLSDFPRMKSIECSLHSVLGRLEGNGIVKVASKPKRWRLP
jgi:hypothetical protein